MSKEERLACGDDVEGDSSGSGKRSRAEIEGNGASLGFQSEGLPRPDGVKKSKAKRNKGKEVASESAILTIGEQMKVNNATREWEATDRRRKIELDEKKEMRK